MILRKHAIALILLTGLVGISCSDSQNARIEVRLTDSPGDYEEVNIDIQDIQINTSGGNHGWQSINLENKGVYNLLELTNGLDTLLGSTELPGGKLSQIRLVLGSNNSIKVSGQTKALFVPSGQQSGLKLNLHQTLVEGITYRILLDFDVARSIVNRGNGEVLLKPVIRSLSEGTSGAIKGSITPIESNPAIYAIAGQDTVGTTYPDSVGKFLIRAVPEGTYIVSFVPKDGFLPKQQSDVKVVVGEVTDLGQITIAQ